MFLFELFLLVCAYRSGETMDAAFHAGLGRGLEEYGRDPEATEAIDDIQTTVNMVKKSVHYCILLKVGKIMTKTSNLCIYIERSICLPICLYPCLSHFQLGCCGVSRFSDWQATPWGLGHGPDKLPHSCCGWTADAVCSVKSKHAYLHEEVRMRATFLRIR